MNEGPPDVSIVLPIYNGAQYLRQSIDSCLRQTHKNIELIIVDDGSTDETPEIIKTYKDARIVSLRHEENKGLPYALNTGFKKAAGEYLTWTSDDNFYADDAIEKMLSFLKNENASFVYCDQYEFNGDDLSSSYVRNLPDRLTFIYGNYVGGCFLYARRVMEAVGEYDVEFKLVEDYDYWMRVSKSFSMRHLKEPLYFYRYHRDSLTTKEWTRYYDLHTVFFLVRIKNRIMSVEAVTNLCIDNLAYWSLKGMGMKGIPILSRILYAYYRLFYRTTVSKKLRDVLTDYERKVIDCQTAKSRLNNILRMTGVG